ncbi:hypothetical protein [uncultured Psychroserpens sp.]|uniref:hypothetical protein n=1 Tax=uncultured Psychroserpens sp. TaxID=255436 RepID=UPI0026259322|nr:hypothetical protein [uncultured Psychroserpens sp.]
MSTLTSYPAKISHYSIRISNSNANIRLFGFENNKKAIGNIDFSMSESNEAISKAFINRGGFLTVRYPLSLLPSILSLLNQEADLFFDESGSFSNNDI